MRIIGPAAEQEAIDAFVRAELDSPRFKALTQTALHEAGVNRTDLWLPGNEGARRDILARTRGYNKGCALFAGFPSDARWTRAEVAGSADWARVKYARFPTWDSLSGGTRSVLDGAAGVDTRPVVEHGVSINESVRSVAKQIRSGVTLSELLLLAVEDAPDSQLMVLLEGHTRATAYVYADPSRAVAVLVGVAPTMAKWAWY